jgi:octaprenyl-diphosphate synthase
VIKGLRDYGMNLGIAFQLADDALDYGGTASALGKNAGDDFREGKVTLPLILAIERGGGLKDGFWDQAFAKSVRDDDDFARARERVIGTGSVSATLDVAGDYADAAKAALRVLPDSDWRDSLDLLADYAVSRVY